VGAPYQNTDFIGELCVALRHEWQPKALFVIFTAYFDEADTHGPAPTVILAGFLGHAYQWRRFETKLGRIQSRYGFRVFHAKDFKAKSGDFAGWSDYKCRDLIADLTDLVGQNLTEGLTVALERDRYLAEYRAPPIPKKLNLDSQYGVCFRSCLSHLIDLMAKRNYRDKLHIIFEGGHKNVGDCLRIFQDLRARCDRHGYPFLGTLTVETKENCMPLMVSDFLAASYSMMKDDQSKTNLSLTDYMALAPAPPKNEASLTFLDLKPDALRKLKTDFERFRQMEIEEWRAQRDARKASVSLGGRPS
jgi:hypothetical protein